MYNYNHLYYFYVTAKCEGISAAAKHLRISQPSLSSQLKVLERSLNMGLFQRVGRRSQLTAAGTALYGLCRQMFEISEEMDELIAKRLPSAARRVHIGVSDEVDRPFVIEFVSLFFKRHGLEQRPKVIIVSGTHEQLVERLRFRELDAVVTQMATIDPELKNLERAEVPVILACSEDQAPRSKKGAHSAVAAISAIQGGAPAQWLMPSSRFKLRAEIDKYFEENDLKGRVVFESDVIASLVRSVVDGVGLAFLPLLYVAREVRERQIRVFGPKAGYWKYRVWLACYAQNQQDPLIQALAASFGQISKQASSLVIHN